MAAALISGEWTGGIGCGRSAIGADCVDKMVKWAQSTLKQACDTAMSRVRGQTRGRRSTYWWSDELANLRAVATTTVRKLSRARKKKKNGDEIVRCLDARRDARRALSRAIKVAKRNSWRDLLDSIEEDPWGRPYKLVLGKLRPYAPPVTETMEEEVLEKILCELFPGGPGVEEPQEPTLSEVTISEEEVLAAARKKGRGRKAPGLDGIPGVVVRAASIHCGKGLAQCFSACLSTGKFPTAWKIARLVLIKKKRDAPPDSSGSYRPICVIGELGKLFERIVVGRINNYLEETRTLSSSQYGFRPGRSTVDAVLDVKNFVEASTRIGKVVILVSLDISNAFNSLPWTVIVRAMERGKFPRYIVDIIKSYLDKRAIAYTNKYGRVVKRQVYCGVPQGSVLGPTLWNIAYDSVLRIPMPGGSRVVCYADDTALLSSGWDLSQAIVNAEQDLEVLVREIEGLGLKVAPQKTEAMAFPASAFCRRRNVSPPKICLRGVRVEVRTSVKYLGIVVDSKMSFRPHFEAVIPKAEGILRHLGRLLPNLHGPGERKRRLYSGVIHSVLLYGAPVWWRAIVEDTRIGRAVRSLQRKVAIRVCCAYRTISFHAAMMIAGIIPLGHLAPQLAETYAAVRGAEEPVSPRAKAVLGALARRRAIEAWKAEELEFIGSPEATGVRTRAAIAEWLAEWIGRPFSIGTTFHTTQLMTGHGCFSAYLYGIRKIPSPRCFHCEGSEDTAEHTLIDCPAWMDARNELIAAMGGGQLTLPEIVRVSLTVPGGWAAFRTFAGRVMRAKEDAERRRERLRADDGCVNERVGSYADGSANDWPHRRVIPVRPPRARLRAAQAAPGSSVAPL
ncbi:hypothetical protein NOK12_39200 [Nocardioides sp. OK12]|nr:hypothetical protein NOK12_39200 [Nocardioides sp. OK12]